MKYLTRNRLGLAGVLLLKTLNYDQAFGATTKTTPPEEVGWGHPSLVGQVDASVLPEASGIASSHLVRNRLYHVNDAGNAPAFVVSDDTGAGAKVVGLEGVATIDPEEIVVGPCPTKGSCVYIADIGDNGFSRPNVSLYVVEEQAEYGSSVNPRFKASLNYPDGLAHNAESLAIHPDGWIYLLTKEIPAQLFRMPLSSIGNGASPSFKSVTLEAVGTLDLRPWLEGTDKPKAVVPTSLAMRPDGRQIVILTRSAGLSFDVDLGRDLPKKGEIDQSDNSPLDLNAVFASLGVSGVRLPLIKLPQMEAITYANTRPDENFAVIYSTEVKEKGRTKKNRRQVEGVPLVRIDSNP